jgi:protein-disulfide isomerase
MRKILIVGAGIVALAAILAGVYFGTRPASNGPTPASVPPSADATALLGVQADDHVLGDPKAPITVIEYASLTCPHCAHFDVVILPKVKEKWIDTGKVKLIYRDFPLDDAALKAAQIAECSGKDRYFAMIDLIFSSQPKWAATSDAATAVEELTKLLRSAGLSDSFMKDCIANDKVATMVLNRQLGGKTLGVDSTPTLYINGQQYKGARSVEELDGVFAKLAK